MSADMKIEREASNRCQSAHLEKVGRTHYCRAAIDHPGKHMCICSLSWEDFEAKQVAS